MLKFAVDENFNMHIVNGVLRRLADADIVRVQDVGLEGADDPTVLAWAASEGRVLLTHDVNTITAFAYERVAQGLAMPGVFEVSLKVLIQSAIEDILLLAECSLEGEWEGQVNYLPLR
jgi:predicted nuclease of predicted toxin-antitoxin system